MQGICVWWLQSRVPYPHWLPRVVHFCFWRCSPKRDEQHTRLVKRIIPTLYRWFSGNGWYYGCMNILLAFVNIAERLDDRQKVIGLRSIVLIHNLLHTFLPLDEQLLPRLASAIGKHAILQILFSQVCHIHEWHTTSIETYEEHISGEIKGRIHREVHLLNSLDDFQRYGSLDGLIHSRINVLEWKALVR